MLVMLWSLEGLDASATHVATLLASEPDDGNFEQDWVIHTADIFFARALRDQQQILWVSDNGIPDLGGDNEEETCYSDQVNQPVLIRPGAYRKVTVELKIHNLAVNALLKSNQVNEMEGGTLFGYDHDLASGLHLPNE